MDWDRFSGFVGEGTYVIINRASLTALEARSLANGSGCQEGLIFGTPESANGPRFWVIDKGMLATEKGKMAVFRSVQYPGSVLDLDRGDASNGTAVSLRPERRMDEHREPQQWLLQVQR
ncbi:MAG: hypothetical protein Q9205_003509 [Flavoplaca limonia]